MKKRTNSFHLLLTAVILLLLSGCKKSFIENQTDLLSSTGNPKGVVRTLGITPDIYVAGSLNGQAVYWKNGQAVTLPGGSQANGIVAVGTDVYVSGWGTNPTTFQFVAQYWKNGVLTNLTDGTTSAFASGIYVSGTDVYISGYLGSFFNYTAVYWKNGVATTLGSGQPNGIFVSTIGDIYMPNGFTAATGPSYWKNTTLTTLTGGDATSYLTAIAVQGSDVYAVGTDDKGSTQTALYWKDGVKQTLFPRQNTEAMAVTVSSSGQALISGTSGPSVDDMQIVCWDALGDLQVASSGEFVSTSTGIAVDQGTGDVYFCGSEFNAVRTGPAFAKYWKIAGGAGSPGPAVVLNDASSNATANAIAIGQ